MFIVTEYAALKILGGQTRVMFVRLFCCVTSQSTAMVMSGWSVHLTALLSLGRLEHAVNQYFVYIHLLVTDNSPL